MLNNKETIVFKVLRVFESVDFRLLKIDASKYILKLNSIDYGIFHLKLSLFNDKLSQKVLYLSKNMFSSNPLLLIKA